MGMKTTSALSASLSALLSLATLLPTVGEACTAFRYQSDGGTYVAKNYDFVMGEGLLFVNSRGMQKRSLAVEQTVHWTSRFGSLTYNQFGREMPVGGMNEAGLVLEVLWLEDTKYAGKDGRGELGVLQWVQYQLDTAGSVSDVIASDGKVRIVDGPGRVHFLVSDRSGATAVLEILDGKLRVYQGAELPITAVANDRYAACVEAEQERTLHPETVKPEWTGLQSLDRFVAVSDYLASGKPAAAPEFGFAGLDRVRHETYTQFQWVYDAAHRRAYLRRAVDRTVQQIDFRDLDFAPRQHPMAADLTRPGTFVWVECTPELNREVMGRSYHKTPFLQQVPDAHLDGLAAEVETFLPVQG
jgi:penicillin V acylase-like amidase (Ntn superfamily)